VNIVSSTTDLGDTRIRQTYGFIRLSPQSAVLDFLLILTLDWSGNNGLVMLGRVQRIDGING